MLRMAILPPSYPGTLESLLGILDILTYLYYNIPPYLPPPPEVEEGSYGSGYFGLGAFI